MARIFILLTSLFSSAILLAISVSPVSAQSARIAVTSQSGVQNTQTASVKAVVYLPDLVTFSQGEEGQIEFVSPQAGQSCVTVQAVSNSQGEITGSCSSTIAGDFVVRMRLLTNSEEGTTVVTFAPEPTPSPTPVVTPTPSPVPTVAPTVAPSPTPVVTPTPTPVQVISGSYTLTPSQTSITFTNEIDTTYEVNVVLKDAVSGEPIENQTGISYFWSTSDTSIVQLDATNAQCVGTVAPPCPLSNGVFSGYKPGSATIFIVTKKDGEVIANTQVEVEITKTTTGQASYTEPTATPTSAPTSTPSSSSNSSSSSSSNNSSSGSTQNATAQPASSTPSPSRTPISSFVPALAGPIATANEEIGEIGEVLGSMTETILDTVAPLPASPTPEQKEERSNLVSVLNLFIFIIIALGVISILMPLYGKHKHKILPYQERVSRLLSPWIFKLRLFLTPMFTQVRDSAITMQNKAKQQVQQFQNLIDMLRLKIEPIQKIIQNRLDLQKK